MKIIWLDEVIFTKTTNLTHEWSGRNKNIWIPVEKMTSGYTAVIAAISKGCGMELIELFDSAVNAESFGAYIVKL